MTASTREPLVGADGEVREITMEDLVYARRGRPPLPSEARKKSVHIMLDPDLLVALKAEGKGWQTRLNATLREAMGL